MACPHVSGVSALYLQANPSAVPEEVSKATSLLCCLMISSYVLYCEPCCHSRSEFGHQNLYYVASCQLVPEHWHDNGIHQSGASTAGYNAKDSYGGQGWPIGNLQKFKPWIAHGLYGFPCSCMVLILQVAAFMRGNAVNGTIVGSLNGVGTPNLLLQTDLSTQPTVTIAPASLAPVVLFEGSFGTASTQTITLTNSDTNNTSVNYQVTLWDHVRALRDTVMLFCDMRHCRGHSVRKGSNGAGEWPGCFQLWSVIGEKTIQGWRAMLCQAHQPGVATNRLLRPIPLNFLHISVFWNAACAILQMICRQILLPMPCLAVGWQLILSAGQ